MERRHLFLAEWSHMKKQLEKVHLIHRILWNRLCLVRLSAFFPTVTPEPSICLAASVENPIVTGDR